MSNFFENVLTNAKKVEEDLLGPDYEYWKQIKSPSEMGMSSQGSISQIAKDVQGLINYIELLTTGQGDASRTGRPLGDKFFLKTGATCKDINSGNVVDRYVYINNVPDGSIPFISAAMDTNFSEFKGLIPGVLGNMSAMNPMQIFQAFTMGSQPDCQEITLETINVNNNSSKETHFVTTIDIQNMNPCNFPDKTNPISKKKCREGFSCINKKRTKIPNDIFVQLFYASIGVLGIYLLISLMRRMKK